MAEKRRFQAEDVLGCKIPAELSAGPGPRISYTLREADLEESAYRAQVWSAVPGEEPVQLTRGEKGCSASRWSPDGRYLAFVSARPDGKPSGEGPRSQVWLLPAGGGEAFCVTKAPHGVRTYHWAPDGQSLFFVADEPEQDAEKARKAREKRVKLDAVVEHAEKRRRQIWQVEPRPGAESKVVFDGCFGLTEIVASPDGTEIAYITNYSGLSEDYRKFDLWTVNRESGQTRQLTRGTGGLSNVAWSPDGARIAFSAPHDHRYSYSRWELMIVPAAGGEVENLCACQGDFCGDVEELAWETSTQLLIQGAVGCYAHIYRADLETGVFTRLTPAEEVASGMVLTADRRCVAYLTETPTTVPDVMLLDLQSTEPARKLTDLNPKLAADFTWGEQTVVSWEGDGGVTIEGVLTLPPGHAEGDRHPLAVYIHGGPHSRTPNRLRQYVNFQVLAARGYAVLAPNYRGGTGYGHEFAVCNRCDLGGADYRDIMAGVDHVIAAGVADPDRMGILGGSYGGYMTNWAIGQTDRFKAAVSMFGIFSLITDYSQSQMPGWEIGYLDSYWWEQPEVYARSSPSTFVQQMTTPVLILHGDADTNTNPANSREMYQSLRHLGRTVQYVRYPREGHGVAEPNHKKDEYRRVLEWFDRYLLGEKPLAEGEVEQDGHRLTLAAAELVESYSGRKPKGRFAELRLQISPAGTLKFDLSQVRVLAEEGDLKWEVGVAGVATGPLLVPAAGTVEIGAPAALALVFDLPARSPAGGWRLSSDAFPAVKITFPVQGE